MRGSKTPANVEAEFRKHYLITGNASGSAKAVGLSPDTGASLAKRANADPEFTEARAALRARLLPDAEQMLRSGLEIALERLNETPPTPRDLAAMALEYGLKSASYQDPRPAYFRGMSSAVAALSGLRKSEGEKQADNSGGVVINIVAPEGMEIVGDDEPKPAA